MRINFSPSLQVNNMISSYQINRSAANKPGVNHTESERKDTFMRSPMGGSTGNLIQDLMKQKLDITDRKNSLIASAKKNGTSMESIKTQIEAFDEQLTNIDIQISQAMTKEMEKQQDKSDQKEEQPKTNEELQYERMTDVVTLSNDAQHVNLVDSVKTKTDGRIKVLESEISLDSGSGRGGASPYKLEELSELKQRSARLASDLGFRMADIAGKIEEEKDELPVKEASIKEASEKEDEIIENISEEDSEKDSE